MSYILDALRKADQERSIGDVPDLDAPHWSQRRAGHYRYWLWGAIGLLIVNGALLAVLFNRDDSGVASGYESDPAQGRPVEPPPAMQEPQQPDHLPLKPLMRPERNVITRPRQALPPAVEKPLASKPAAIAMPRAAPADSAPGTPVEEATAAAVQPAVPEPAQSDIPEWGELSLEFRSGFNPPRLDVHVYDEEPSRRFILVNLQRFVEGDMLDDGAKLEKILPGSIQLYYQGTRFRIDR